MVNYNNSMIYKICCRDTEIKDTIYKNGCVQVSSVDRI